MQENRHEDETNKEELEEVKFGYKASIVFLIFIGFVIYVSVTR